MLLRMAVEGFQWMFTSDLIVIGARRGRYVVAIRASQLGLKTAIVERSHLRGPSGPFDDLMIDQFGTTGGNLHEIRPNSNLRSCIHRFRSHLFAAQNTNRCSRR